jgi:hypothetical protein
MKDFVMNANKKNAALRMTTARTTALAGVRRAAFNSGTSRNAVIAATRAALGAKPILMLYNAGKLELQIGFMAAALAAKGDNREPEALMTHCRDRLLNYQGFGGKAKLRQGQKGRRTKDEELAYGSARVSVSQIMKDAGVRVPETRGGDTAATRKPRPASKATAAKAVEPTRKANPKFKTKGELVAYCQLQHAAMLATINKNAALAPIELKSAVQDFGAAIKKLA